MMAIGLIEELSSQHEYTVAYSFCQNADRELNTLESIIKGLILGLMYRNPELKESLRRRWDTKNDRFIEDCTSWRNLWNILFEMLVNQYRHSKVYLIVDALDECQDDGMADFLRLIVRNGLDQPTKLKWLLTSRPLKSAERALLTGYEQMQVSLELNSSSISRAVEAYISHKVDELSVSQKYVISLKKELRAELSAKSGDTFLWVSLVCKGLESVSQENALDTLQNFPLGLDALYDRVMSQLRTGEMEDVHKCMRLLKVMMLAYRPLDVAEVPILTGLAETDDSVKALVDRCASFLRIQANNIEFVHQSIRDYLAKENIQPIFEVYTSFGHHNILQNCLSQLSEYLKVNLLDLPRPDSTRDSSALSQDEKPSIKIRYLEYAATFWVRHFTDADQSATIQRSSLEAICKFLHAKFLEWLECLSLLGRLSLAIKSLDTLSDLVEVRIDCT